ncbi:hypothetical protein P3W24_11185 [Luteibacter sp. PPL201]|uniref:Uncharacterized protein n=1 Tax=Luteibacter sahnii TaxID=3021977 RepID=A0ABT6BC31_9GAMM
MLVHEQAWRWPHDLHPLLAVVGGMGIGRKTVTPEGVPPDRELEPFHVEKLLARDNAAGHFARLVRWYPRAAISGFVPKFIAPESRR